MSNSIFRTGVTALALLVSACTTTYVERAPGVASMQFGTLEQKDPIHSGVLVDRVDGRWRGIRPATSYRLSPGEHSLGGRANLPFVTSTPRVIWFDVAPGGHYLLQAFGDADTGQWGFGVVNASGQRVDRLWSNAPHGAAD